MTAPTTVVESRVKNGSLTFGAPGDEVSFACQVSSVKLTPSYEDDGDKIELLCGQEIPAGKIESWTLNGTSVQDFDNPLGFVVYCRQHAMTIVPFEWEPNTVGAETASGSVQVLAVEWGGDVNTRLTTDWEFDVVGELTFTPSVP